MPEQPHRDFQSLNDRGGKSGTRPTNVWSTRQHYANAIAQSFSPSIVLEMLCHLVAEPDELGDWDEREKGD